MDSFYNSEVGASSSEDSETGLYLSILETIAGISSASSVIGELDTHLF